MRLSSGRALALVAVVSLCGSCNSRPDSAAAPREASSLAPSSSVPPAPAAAEQQRTSAAPVRYDGPLPPLPSPGYEAPRPPEMVRAVYEFAARRPDVLHYVPCFCGCERSGHVGNDDCFVKRRDAAGRPEWDVHGYS